MSAYGCQDHRSDTRTQGVQLPSGTPLTGCRNPRIARFAG
jgi:hypothetical protein